MWSDKLGWLAFLFPFAVWTWLAGPSPGWLDSPELVAAAASLGISHPPGHPAYLLFAHLFSLLPLGSIAFRLTLFSACSFAIAVWLTYRAGLHLLALVPRLSPSSSWNRILILIPALVMGFLYSTCLQAVRPEVYAFHAALCMAALERCLAGFVAATEGRTPREFWLALWFVALALANHHYLMVVMLPGCLLLSIASGFWRGNLPKRLALVILVVTCGLATYLYLPIRSARLGPVHWGHAHSVKGATWLVTAQAWHHTVQPVQRRQSMAHRAVLLLSLYLEQIGALWLSLALVGFYFLCRRSLWLAMTVGLWWLGGLMPRLLTPVNLQDADLHGYLLPTFLLMAWGIGFGLLIFLEQLVRLQQALLKQEQERDLMALIRRAGLWGLSIRFVKRRLLVLGYIGLLCFLLGSLVATIIAPAPEIVPGKESVVDCCDQRSQVSPLLWMDFSTRLLPRGSLLLTGYYQTGFLQWYRQVVERHRPDLTVLQRNLLAFPHVARVEKARNPGYKALIQSIAQRDGTLLAQLAKVAKRKTICLEWYQDLPKKMSLALYPVGLYFQWYPEHPVEQNDIGHAFDDLQVMNQQKRFWKATYGLFGKTILTDQRFKENLLWVHYMHAKVYAYSGRWKAGLAELHRALKLAPGDKKLQSMHRILEQKLALTREPRRPRTLAQLSPRSPGIDNTHRPSTASARRRPSARSKKPSPSRVATPNKRLPRLPARPRAPKTRPTPNKLRPVPTRKIHRPRPPPRRTSKRLHTPKPHRRPPLALRRQALRRKPARRTSTPRRRILRTHRRKKSHARKVKPRRLRKHRTAPSHRRRRPPRRKTKPRQRPKRAQKPRSLRQKRTRTKTKTRTKPKTRKIRKVRSRRRKRTRSKAKTRKKPKSRKIRKVRSRRRKRTRSKAKTRKKPKSRNTRSRRRKRTRAKTKARTKPKVRKTPKARSSRRKRTRAKTKARTRPKTRKARSRRRKRTRSKAKTRKKPKSRNTRSRRRKRTRAKTKARNKPPARSKKKSGKSTRKDQTPGKVKRKVRALRRNKQARSKEKGRKRGKRKRELRPRRKAKTRRRKKSRQRSKRKPSRITKRKRRKKRKTKPHRRAKTKRRRPPRRKTKPRQRPQRAQTPRSLRQKRSRTKAKTRAKQNTRKTRKTRSRRRKRSRTRAKTRAKPKTRKARSRRRKRTRTSAKTRTKPKARKTRKIRPRRKTRSNRRKRSRAKPKTQKPRSHRKKRSRAKAKARTRPKARKVRKTRKLRSRRKKRSRARAKRRNRPKSRTLRSRRRKRSRTKAKARTRPKTRKARKARPHRKRRMPRSRRKKRSRTKAKTRTKPKTRKARSRRRKRTRTRAKTRTKPTARKARYRRRKRTRTKAKTRTKPKSRKARKTRPRRKKRIRSKTKARIKPKSRKARSHRKKRIQPKAKIRRQPKARKGALRKAIRLLDRLRLGKKKAGKESAKRGVRSHKAKVRKGAPPRRKPEKADEDEDDD